MLEKIDEEKRQNATELQPNKLISVAFLLFGTSDSLASFLISDKLIYIFF